MKVVFVSNYINHHQIPFCNAMYERLNGEFVFVQTEPMEAERVQMGWDESGIPSYVKCYYGQEFTQEAEQRASKSKADAAAAAVCDSLIADADVVLFGGTDDESYIAERLQSGKPVIRISERLYKEGQWKAISPRGLKKKYQDHTKYRKAPVYLLCAGGYVASDFHIVRAYPQKMFCWGYFPQTKHYDVDKLLEKKGRTVNALQKDFVIPQILWAGRMIDWKHPELALETAKYLKEKNVSFHMNIIGGGELLPKMKELAAEYGLQDTVEFLGFQAPENVRKYMEEADIYLFTSNRKEGWGAVANEAMNSGCALVANHMIGAVPYLVKNGENGFVYRDGDKEQLFALTQRLAQDKELRKKLGKNAYETIVNMWNAEYAAKKLLELIRTKVLSDKGCYEAGQPKALRKNKAAALEGKEMLHPCSPAPILSERAAGKL